MRAVPRSTRRLFRNAHDPRTTPFLERSEDIRRVFLALPKRYGVAFAIGALGGLRPGEVLGLDWRDVDLGASRILVRQQVHRGRLGPVKDDESRIVPILKPLAPVLAEWRLAHRRRRSALLAAGRGQGRATRLRADVRARAHDREAAPPGARRRRRLPLDDVVLRHPAHVRVAVGSRRRGNRSARDDPRPRPHDDIGALRPPPPRRLQRSRALAARRRPFVGRGPSARTLAPSSSWGTLGTKWAQRQQSSGSGGT